MNEAQKAVEKLNLIKSSSGYDFYFNNEINNDELITELQEMSTNVFQGEEIELFVFSDGSCINRQSDEYFVNDNVKYLATEYLESVGYL